MDFFDDKREGFIWGIRVVFWWVIFAMISLVSAWLMEYRKKKERIQLGEDKSESESEIGMEADIEDFVRLEIRRRMVLSSR